MKTKVLLLTAVMFLSINVFAQYGGGGYFFAGYNYFVNVPTMNANITGFNNTLPQGMPMLGGGGYAIIKGVVIGGRGMGSSFEKEYNLQGVKAYYTYGGGEFNLGYVLLNKKSFMSFLYLGIGGFGYGAQLINKTGSSVDLGSVVIGDGAEVSFNYGSTTLSGGLSFNFLKLKGFSIGLDISYIYPFSTNNQSVMVGLTIGGLGVSNEEE